MIFNLLKRAKDIFTDKAYTGVEADNVEDAIRVLQQYLESVEDEVGKKQPSIEGGASTITSKNLTGNRILVSDTNGKVASSSLSTTKLSYLKEVTSDIQTQLDDKEPIVATSSGKAVAWNCQIEEQRCTRYGKLCTVFVRGSYDGGVSAIPRNVSIFSLPWRIKDINNYVGVQIALWNGNEPSHERPVLEHAVLEQTYNTIQIEANPLECKKFSFYFVYVCE